MTIAQILNGNARAAETLRLAERALEINQELHGGDYHAVALSLTNVALGLQSLGRCAEALPKYEAALEMTQRLFEGDNSDVAWGLNNVAACLQSLGRSAEALPKFEAALEMTQRFFQDDHPDVAGSLNNVAACLRFLGRSAEALPKYEAALEMYRRILRPGHPKTLYPQIGLAWMLAALGRYSEAEPLLHDAAEQCERSEAARRLHWCRVLKATVKLYDAWHAAEPDQGYDAKAAEWRAKLPPAERADSLIKLGMRLLKDGRYAETEAALRACLEIRREALAQGHWLIFNTMSVLGASLTGQGADRSLTVAGRVGGNRSLTLAARKEAVADRIEKGAERSLTVAVRIGKLREAEPLLIEGYEGLTATAESIPEEFRAQRIREAIQRIVKLYDTWHAAEADNKGDHGRDAHGAKAAEWRAKLPEENGE